MRPTLSLCQVTALDALPNCRQSKNHQRLPPVAMEIGLPAYYDVCGGAGAIGAVSNNGSICVAAKASIRSWLSPVPSD